MDADGLLANIGYLGSRGVVLSVEQRASLQSSLTLLKREHKFLKVKLWGIVRGIGGDYFIAMGVGKDEIAERKAVYSQDCLEWNLMPHVDEGLKMKSSLLQGRFTGNPDHVFQHTVTHRVGEGENTQEQTTTVEMKEVDRLAAVVARADEETAIVPRGAFLRGPLGGVTLNKSFQGLSLAEAKQLQYYLHFRTPDPNNEKPKSILDATNFLESIEKDIPRGCWSLQCDQGGAVVVLQSLQWIGMVAYHTPGTPNFGYFYCGTGEKNLDLLFML